MKEILARTPESLVEADADTWEEDSIEAPQPVVDRSGDPGRLDARLTRIVIRPTAGWRSINFGELWRSRELLFFLIWRDVKVRYKQTVFGAGWAIFQPVMTTIVFNVVFGKFGKMAESVELPYPVFLYAALLPWTFFAGAVSQGGISLIQSRQMISKIYFPRLLIPFSAVGGQSVDFAISFLVMVGMMVWFGVAPSLNLLLLPVLVVGTIVAALGASTLLASLSITYRDFRYVIPFMIQLWMFACPVPYDISRVPQEWLLLYALNPMAGMVDGFRSALLGQPFHWSVLGVSFASTGILFIAGLAYFRRVERRFADIA
ncbi:MAG: ABC transporter permease [Planctomycetaceae bacterium]|nr:ABC transporter permease [Planctomycetaceae bacterium]